MEAQISEVEYVKNTPEADIVFQNIILDIEDLQKNTVKSM